MVRKPIVAGRFYPARADACRAELVELFRDVPEVADLPTRICAGIVPHAGWVCSGRVTARVFAALASHAKPDTAVLFGAVHRWPGERAAMFATGSWETPLGLARVDEELAAAVRAASADVDDQPDAHFDEHSLEVQTPFVQWVFPAAQILPIMVPPAAPAAEIGAAVARAIAASGRSVLLVGTTDLTHYGPSYGFTPAGTGDAGLRWARDVNDRRMVELIVQRAAGSITPEARRSHNACGPGAITATLAAATALGADRVAVIEHTTSAEVLGAGQQDSVGYLGAVLGNN